MPPYRRLDRNIATSSSRFELRASARIFVPAPSLVPPAAGAAATTWRAGFLWEQKTCPHCASGATLDVFHRAAECPALDAARLSALDRAAARARQSRFPGLEQVFVDVKGMLHTRAGQAFVFMGAVGASLSTPSASNDAAPDAAGPCHGLPNEWAAAFESAALSTPLSQAVERGAATAVTFPAFGELARLIARPLGPAAAPGLLADPAAGGGAHIQHPLAVVVASLPLLPMPGDS